MALVSGKALPKAAPAQPRPIASTPATPAKPTAAPASVVTSAAPNSEVERDSRVFSASARATNSKYSPSTSGSGTPISSSGWPSIDTRMRAGLPCSSAS